MRNIVLGFIVSLLLFALVARVAQAATSLQLSAPHDILQNKPFDVTVIITSSDLTLGTDVVLAYDPDVLTVTSVTPGPVYPNTSNVQPTANDGTISFSGVSYLTEGITPNGMLATVTFVPITAGQTTVSFSYDPEDSSLSGVVPFEGEGNLLAAAPAPLSLTIKSPNLLIRLVSFVRNLLTSLFSF